MIYIFQFMFYSWKWMRQGRRASTRRSAGWTWWPRRRPGRGKLSKTCYIYRYIILKSLKILSDCLLTRSVVDPEWFIPDPDPALNSKFRIRIQAKNSGSIWILHLIYWTLKDFHAGFVLDWLMLFYRCLLTVLGTRVTIRVNVNGLCDKNMLGIPDIYSVVGPPFGTLH